MITGVSSTGIFTAKAKIMANNNNLDRMKMFNNRLRWLKIIFTVFAALLAIYLFGVQILDIKHYAKKAKAQRIAKKFIMRGSILDRNGIKLASDQLSYNVYVHRQYMDHFPCRTTPFPAS